MFRFKQICWFCLVPGIRCSKAQPGAQGSGSFVRFFPIGYLYDLENPQQGPLETIRKCVESHGHFLKFGIHYADDTSGERTGRLDLKIRRMNDWASD
eukprot:s4698_g2.t1